MIGSLRLEPVATGVTDRRLSGATIASGVRAARFEWTGLEMKDEICPREYRILFGWIMLSECRNRLHH